MPSNRAAAVVVVAVVVAAVAVAAAAPLPMAYLSSFAVGVAGVPCMGSAVGWRGGKAA